MLEVLLQKVPNTVGPGIVAGASFGRNSLKSYRCVAAVAGLTMGRSLGPLLQVSRPSAPFGTGPNLSQWHFQAHFVGAVFAEPLPEMQTLEASMHPGEAGPALGLVSWEKLACFFGRLGAYCHPDI